MQTLRMKFAPTRVVEYPTTEGGIGHVYFEAGPVHDALDDTVHHDQIWPVAPNGQLSMTIKAGKLADLISARQPFYVDMSFVDPNKMPEHGGLAGPLEPKPKSQAKTKAKGKAKKKSKSTAAKSGRKGGKKKGRSRPTATPQVQRPRAGGERTSAAPDQPQPVTNPGGNE